MKTTQSSGIRPDHQTVAGTFEFKSNGKAIAIGFTDQQLSPHAGSALFWGWLRPLDWCKQLAAALPHPLPLSNNKLLPLEKALGPRNFFSVKAANIRLRVGAWVPC